MLRAAIFDLNGIFIKGQKLSDKFEADFGVKTAEFLPKLSEIMDKAYFSWQTGLVKPNPQAWQLVLNENNLKPEECVYFDDQEKNTKAAESIGIKSFLFTDVESLKKEVMRLL
ncbi:MAG: HAD-IA family hydrolase [Patescibacteria group bacterium]